MSELREHLLAIYKDHGKLTPDLLVEEARPEHHPLHSQIFDRAPDEAAEAWYRHQAAELIRSVKIRYVDRENVRQEVRAFHVIRVESGYVYEPAEAIALDPFKREMLLRDMEREWRQLLERYKSFEEFAQMVSEDIAA